MRKYIDPIYLAIVPQEWQNRSYLEIFNSINVILTRIEDVERSIERSNQLVKFRNSEELFATVYSHNPFINDPKVEEFYSRLFQDRILPELSRRFEYCPSQCKPPEQNVAKFTVQNPWIPEGVLREWQHLLDLCLSCDPQEQLALIAPIAGYTRLLENESDITSDRLLVIHNADRLFDVADFLSTDILASSSLRESSFRMAIEVYYNQQVLCGDWSAGRQPQDYVFNDLFWASIDRAQLAEEDRDYKQKFVSAMAQVVYDLDIDIRKHKYKGETILIQNKKYPKYSADVFKMGRGSSDRRCSRIFYSKAQDILHFCELDPDRHGGE